MTIKTVNISVVVAILLASGNEAYAGLQEASDAYRKGKYSIALEEFNKLATAGDATMQDKLSAQYMLGVMHANGDGVAQDYSKAVTWYRKAAEQGDAKAQFNLGVRYANGQGVALDYKEAASWYSRAAEQGQANAQNNLGTLYYSGLGVQRDFIQAYKWISLASSAGEMTATNNKKMVEASMTPEQIEEAQSLVLDWQAARNADVLPSPAQSARRNENANAAQKQHATPFLPTPVSDSRTASGTGTDVEADSRPTKPPEISSRAPAYNGNSVLSSPPTGAVLDISLGRAIDIAKETSFRLGRSQRNIDGAIARYNAASSMYLPRFDTGLLATQASRTTTGIAPGTVPQFNASLSLGITQPLDIGRVIGRQVTQAELARRAAEYDLDQSHLDVSFEVGINYYNALRAQEIVRVDKQSVEDLERLAAKIGEAPDGISNFIQVELSNARQTLTSSRTILDLSFDTLKQSLRLDPGTAIQLTDSFSHGAVAMDGMQALQEALAKRPDIGQIGVRIEQTRLSAEQVSDARKPTLNLQLFANNAYYSHVIGNATGNPSIYDRGVMLTLNMPLVYFDWGNLSETKRAALLQNEQAQFDLQEQRERVGLEVRQAVIALKRAEQRINTLPDLALAQDALRRAESDFLAAGKRADPATLAQMSNARASRRFAETVTIDALYEYNIAIFNLKHAIGTDPQMTRTTTAIRNKNPS